MTCDVCVCQKGFQLCSLCQQLHTMMGWASIRCACKMAASSEQCRSCHKCLQMGPRVTHCPRASSNVVHTLHHVCTRSTALNMIYFVSQRVYELLGHVVVILVLVHNHTLSIAKEPCGFLQRGWWQEEEAQAGIRG